MCPGPRSGRGTAGSRTGGSRSVRSSTRRDTRRRRDELRRGDGQRPDGLERREREQREQRELDACERARVNGGRGHHEHGDDGEHRERRHRPLGERLDERGAPPGTRERAIGGFDSSGGRVGRPVGHELRRRGERVEQLGGQLGARRRLVLERGVRERHAGEREDDAGQQQEEREHDAGNGQHDEPDGDRQRAGDQRDDGWAEAPEVETLQRVDVARRNDRGGRPFGRREARTGTSGSSRTNSRTRSVASARSAASWETSRSR